MRISLVTKRFAGDGGIGRTAVELCQALLDQDFRVHVACMDHAPIDALPRGRSEGALVIERVPMYFPGSLPRLLAFAAGARRAARAARSDVTLALARVPGLDIFRAGGGCHAEYLRTVSGWRFSPRQRAELGLDRACVRQALRVVTNAPGPREQLIRHYGVPSEKVAVIPNGVDTRRFRPDPEARAALRQEMGIAPETPLVIFLGAGFQRKGLSTAIEAVARLPGAVLAVAGGDRATGAYVRLARKLGSRLVLRGADAAPERLLAAGDALLLPTRYDAASNAVLEAMACGIPAITSGANGASAFVPDPWLVVEDPANAAAFADILRRALADPDIGFRCRRVALGMTWELNRDAMVRLAHEVVAEKALRQGSSGGAHA